LAGEIARVAIGSAEPAARVRACWPAALREADRVTVLAVGKAAAAMGNEAFEHLGDRLIRGVVVCPGEHADRVDGAAGRVRAIGADHPIPTGRNLVAAEAVADLAEGMGEGDRLLVLLSGGASAYLCSPVEDVGLEDLQGVTRGLLASGATIDEVNAVRKHLEVLKGGGLARLVSPADSTVLVLSDVLGDPLDVIGSGPMSPDPTTFAGALEVVTRRGVLGVSRAAEDRLRRGAAGEFAETPKPGDAVFERVTTRVIGNNGLAVAGVCARMEQFGFGVVERRERVRGEAAEVGRALAVRVRGLGAGEAVVWGGETTVTVRAERGVGGPCQELALAAAVGLDGLHGEAGCGVVTIATDGIDGPTDAAGAWVGPGVLEAWRAAGVDPTEAIRRHDSHGAFAALSGTEERGGLLVPGATGTNVNDVYVGLRV